MEAGWGPAIVQCPLDFLGGNKPMCSGDEQIAERTGPVVPCSRGGLVSKFEIVAWSEHGGWLLLCKLWIPLPPRPPGCQPASLGDKSTSFDAQSATVEDAGATGTVYRTMSGLWKDPRLAEPRRKGTFNQQKVGSPPPARCCLSLLRRVRILLDIIQNAALCKVLRAVLPRCRSPGN